MDFIQRLLKKNEEKLVRFIDDILSLNTMYKKCNSKFCDFVDHIYPIEFEINDIVDATRSASYLYNECRLKTKLYDKREVFNLYVATFQQHMYMEYTGISLS
jgi:hypothetical protein